MSRRLLFASLTLCLAGACFSPRYESGRLKCAGEGAVCPSGFFCSDGRCWRDGEMPARDGGGDVSVGPRVVQGAAATPAPVLATTTNLSALGDDPAGEGNLSYTWALSGMPPGVVGYSDNGTNSAKNTIAIFTTAGQYSFTVNIANRQGLSVSSAVDVEVQQKVNDLAVIPSMASVALGGMQQFSATAFDQFGNPFNLPVPVKWSLVGNCGVVSESGLFQAGSAGSGVCTVVAMGGNVMVNATVSVGSAQPVLLLPVADTYVEEVNPDRNFGMATTLLVKSQSDSLNNRITYLRFSLAGVPAPVSAARLRLFGRSNMVTHQDGAFAIADNAWTETGLTWKNRPMMGTRLTRIGVTTAPKYHEWDLTAYVQARQAAGDATLNVAIFMEVPVNEAPDSFESRESAMNKPQLVLTP